MARRSRSRSNNDQIKIIAAVVLAVVAVVVIIFMSKKGGSSGGSGGNLTPLNVRDYMEGSGSLRGNPYRLKGRIDNREDPDWSVSDGRLYSFLVDDDSTNTPVPLYVPAKFNSEKLERNQECIINARVNDQGILEVEEFLK